MRIAVYGGSFNPPHVAHQLVCTYVLATAEPAVDRLLMVPTYQHPFGKALAPYEDRVEMCQAAASLFGGRVEVSRIEEELGGASYTLTTVEALAARNPGARISLVIGADLLAERARWHGWDRLQTLVDFLVIGRAGNSLALAAGAHDELRQLELPAVSSTEVRARVAADQDVSSLLDGRVWAHIRARGLYRTPNGAA